MGRQGGGAIVTITSGAAFGGRVRNGAYGTAKAAIYGMTLVLANELRPFNINVNAVAPGYTRTRSTDRVFGPNSPVSEQDRATWSIESRTAQPQPPENVAPLVVWLCTEEARKVSGQLFRVFGDRITIHAPPPVVASVFKTGGGLWAVEDVASVIPGSLPGASAS
jgi:3-oxoacyl-[acyl-carrier protein] reductase